MRDSRARIVLGVLILALALNVARTEFSDSLVPKVYAREQACTLATLNARYGFTFEALVTGDPVPAPITAFIPVAGGGVMTFDGRGNLSGSQTVSFGGAIGTAEVWGTYLVNQDCRGSMTGTFSDSGQVFNLEFVIVDGAREILAMASDVDSGVLAIDRFVRQ